MNVSRLIGVQFPNELSGLQWRIAKKFTEKVK